VKELLPSVRTIQARLDSAGVASIVIGGVAVAVWGEPRLTRDVDLKVLLGRQDAAKLLDALGEGYVLLALERFAMLFVRDENAVRIDLLLGETTFDVEAIRRGRDVEVAPGVQIHACSPEDLVIYKLVSTRPRDHEDARGVVLRQGDGLDREYVVRWLREFEAALDDSTLVSAFEAM